MRISGKTDIGKVRASNQDSFLVISNDEIALAVVCDGMGGHSGGDIASDLAVNSIKTKLESELKLTPIKERNIEKLITLLINHANEVIFSKALVTSELRGMGTTIVLAFIVGDDIYIAHVGDSRAYILFEDTFKRATKDHSVVQEMIDSGELTEQQADQHPYKHVITRVLGVAPEIKIDFSTYKINEPRKILLCTDGLSNELSDLDIKNVLEEDLTPEQMCEKFIEKANNNSGKDNITAVVIDLPAQSETKGEM